jgi:hypothetical protein
MEMVSLCCDFSMISGISRVCHVCTAWDQHQPQRLCSFVVDVLAVSVLALSFFIGSKVLKPPFFTTNIFSPLANELMVIAWPPLYGWCLARAIFRAITAPKGKDLSEWFNFWCWFRAFLSSRIWTPLAILSYGAYVLQFIIGRWALPYFLDAVNLSFSGLTRDDVWLGEALQILMHFLRLMDKILQLVQAL